MKIENLVSFKTYKGEEKIGEKVSDLSHSLIVGIVSLLGIELYLVDKSSNVSTIEGKKNVLSYLSMGRKFNRWSDPSIKGEFEQSYQETVQFLE